MTTDSSFLFNLNTFASSSSSSTTSSLISTANSCSSTTSSNSSSFIQLANDTDDQQKQSLTSTITLVVEPAPIVRYKFLLNAYVNGFVQLKLCADKIDYEYIIELYWSNNSKTFIKRTYEDFVAFHRKLVNEFCLKNSNPTNASKNKLKQFILNSNFVDKTSNCEREIPTLSEKKPFWMNRLKLAELRETELNSYVQRLVKLPILISHSSTVLEFFETQTSDPKPANLNNPTNLNVYNLNEAYAFADPYETTDSYEVTRTGHQCGSDNNDAGDNDNDDSDDNTYNNMKNISNNGTSDDNESALWWDEDNALNELTCSANHQSLINIDYLYDNDNNHVEQFESLEQILNKNYNSKLDEK